MLQMLNFTYTSIHNSNLLIFLTDYTDMNVSQKCALNRRKQTVLLCLTDVFEVRKIYFNKNLVKTPWVFYFENFR